MDAAPSLTRYGAKVHAVEVHWRLRNTRAVVVGPAPRLVLALRARRDVEVLLVRVDFPEFLNTPGEAESLLAVVPHAIGLRRLRPEGEWRVWGQEDVDAVPMLGGKSEDAVALPTHARWHGATVEHVEHNVCRHPFDYWCYRGRVAVPRGFSLGVIVRADVPTICRVTFAGV